MNHKSLFNFFIIITNHFLLNMGSGGLKYENLHAGDISAPISTKSVTGSLGGNAGMSLLGPLRLSSSVFSELIPSSGRDGSGAGVASILDEGLLGSVLVALEVGRDPSSLEAGRE